jgi:phosphohistidine phosphatase
MIAARLTADMTPQVTRVHMGKSASELRHLFLLRHAQAADGGPKLPDIDRPLSERGRRQAAFVAEHLHAVPIDYVLCSPSTRTRDTADPILRTRCSEMPTVVYDRKLYEASAEDVLEAVSKVPAKTRSLLVVGHNPSMENVLAILATSTGGIEGFKKGACVHLTTTSPWDGLSPGGFKVASYYRGESESSGSKA